MKTVELTKLVTNTLDEHKALQITDFDVAILSDVVDHVIICSATSRRHASTLARKVIRRVKENSILLLGVEGETESEWILIDLCDVIVHIMLSEIRNFYGLEELWSMKKIDSR